MVRKGVSFGSRRKKNATTTTTTTTSNENSNGHGQQQQRKNNNKITNTTIRSPYKSLTSSRVRQTSLLESKVLGCFGLLSLLGLAMFATHEADVLIMNHTNAIIATESTIRTGIGSSSSSSSNAVHAKQNPASTRVLNDNNNKNNNNNNNNVRGATTNQPSTNSQEIASTNSDIKKSNAQIKITGDPQVPSDNIKKDTSTTSTAVLVVRDADGDIVNDDVLRKDILAGRNVEERHVEEAETDVEPGQTRWSQSKTIPQWLKDYFDWHSKIVPTINEETWTKHHYLVMSCLGGETCGNVAHRLRPIMGMLRVAADYRRIFLIHWDMPNRLEDFLHPPVQGGVQWQAPQVMVWKIRKSPIVNVIPNILKQAPQDRRVVHVMYNDDTHAENYFNDHRLPGELEAQEVFRDVWQCMFRPTFMLTERLQETMDLMGLVPGEYASAHIDYELVPNNSHEQNELRLKVEQAMNCMSALRPGGPFFVAAQTYAIAREAMLYGKHRNVVVQAKQIAHDTNHVPKDLFQSFIEIFLMVNTRCVAYNRAGYGQLGYMLGFDYNCKVLYGHQSECQWTDRAKNIRVEHFDGHHHKGDSQDDDRHQNEPALAEEHHQMEQGLQKAGENDQLDGETKLTEHQQNVKKENERLIKLIEKAEKEGEGNGKPCKGIEKGEC